MAQVGLSSVNVLELNSISVATDVADYDPLDMSLTFPIGTSDGTEVCANVTLTSDMLVECDEEFTVHLSLNSSKENLHLANNYTTVTIQDSDCKLYKLRFHVLLSDFVT